MTGDRGKCGLCGKLIAASQPGLVDMDTSSDSYCRCGEESRAGIEIEGAEFQDATVKTAAADSDFDSEYFDQELKARFKILSFIGSGGGGIIYKVQRRDIDEEVVLKLIKQNLPEQAKERFELEAKACSLIEHANVVGILEYGVTASGVNYIVMPFCDGVSLRSILQEKSVTSADEMIDLFCQICAGLEASHEEGIIHRDMKPENVLVENSERGWIARLIDFGVAKVQPAGGEIQALTQTGEIFGTPAYMSPEQCVGQPVDERTDIYAVGCMLFEAFSGQQPFRGESAFVTLSHHLNDDPPSLPESGALDAIPDGLEYVVHRCMSKDPASRYQSAGELSDELFGLRGANRLVPRLRRSMRDRKIVFPVLVLLSGLLVYSISTMIPSLAPEAEVSKSVKPRKLTQIEKYTVRLEEAVNALNRSDAPKAEEIANSIISRLERLPAGKNNANNSKSEKEPDYEAILREAYYIRGHAKLLRGESLEAARDDLSRCVQTSPGDPYYRSSLAHAFLKLGKPNRALKELTPVRPTASEIRKRIGTPPDFKDNWNNPSVFERIKAANQEVVFQDIVRVDAFNNTWTPVDIEIKPGYRLWIDARDDGYWTSAARPHGVKVWTDADGFSGRRVYEANLQSLVGMVGDNHSFAIGKHYWNGIAPGTGLLRLFCNDGVEETGSVPDNGVSPNISRDNRGSIKVRVIVTRPVGNKPQEGWTNRHVFSKIKSKKQRVRFQTVLTVDSRSPTWTHVNGFRPTPQNRIWIDTRATDRWSLAPSNSGRGRTRVNANGIKQQRTNGFPVGKLIGKIGNTQFAAGRVKENYKPLDEDKLMLIMNDGGGRGTRISDTGSNSAAYGDNQGYITVRVIVTEPSW